MARPQVGSPTVLDMQENARRLGHQRWLHLQLFELLGGWAADTPEAHLRQVFAAHCHHHAWHAQLIADRLPKIDELDTETLTVPADASVQQMVAQARAAATTADRVALVYGTIHPRLISELAAHLHAVDPRTDGPTARVLTLVLRDLQAAALSVG